MGVCLAKFRSLSRFLLNWIALPGQFQTGHTREGCGAEKLQNAGQRKSGLG